MGLYVSMGSIVTLLLKLLFSVINMWLQPSKKKKIKPKPKVLNLITVLKFTC